MELNALLSDLRGGVSLRTLILYIILGYVALRVMFLYIARKYLNKHLPIQEDHAREDKIQRFFIKALDFPLLLYVLFVIFSVITGYFKFNIFIWYLGLLVVVIGIEYVTGIVRNNYVKRIQKERRREAEMKAKQQKNT